MLERLRTIDYTRFVLGIGHTQKVKETSQSCSMYHISVISPLVTASMVTPLLETDRIWTDMNNTNQLQGCVRQLILLVYRRG